MVNDVSGDFKQTDMTFSLMAALKLRLAQSYFLRSGIVVVK